MDTATSAAVKMLQDDEERGGSLVGCTCELHLERLVSAILATAHAFQRGDE